MNKFAIIKTGGKQYLVQEKQDLEVEKIEGKVGDKIELEQLLLAVEQEQIFIGDPLVKNAKVVAQIKNQGKDKKISVIKFKSKSRYRRKTGHRQLKTKIIIEKIVLPGKKSREK